MKKWPNTVSDDEIREAVVSWSETLALGQYAEALEMFPMPKDGYPMSPEALKAWIENYGSESPLEDGRRCRITTLRGRSDAEEIIQTRIEVDRREHRTVDPNRYLGVVYYDEIPLDGQRSDLTARFRIRRLDPQTVTLEFQDVYVM